MNIRTRKLIGTLMLFVCLGVYALLAMGVAVRILPGASGLVEFLYYLVAGMGWVLPAGLIIKWMSRGADAAQS